MANFFNLILDTTPPFIQVVFRKSLSSNTIVQMEVTADDELGENQSVEIVDSLGITHIHKLILSPSKRMAIASIELEGYPEGLAATTLQIYDEVLNKSNIISTQLDVGLFKGVNSYLKLLCITDTTLIAILDNSKTVTANLKGKDYVNVKAYKIDAEYLDALLDDSDNFNTSLADGISIKTMVK